jgi:hypothetical protein
MREEATHLKVGWIGPSASAVPAAATVMAVVMVFPGEAFAAVGFVIMIVPGKTFAAVVVGYPMGHWFSE